MGTENVALTKGQYYVVGIIVSDCELPHILLLPLYFYYVLNDTFDLFKQIGLAFFHKVAVI